MIATLEMEPLVRLTRDLKASAGLLTPEQARFLVDCYYSIQGYRIRAGGQERAMNESGEPHQVIQWVFGNMETMENDIKRALDKFSDSQVPGQWAKSIVGIGPVLAAGLLAHTDITFCPTAGHLWSFCFPAGTLIDTPHGPVPIQLLEVEDEVVAYNGELDHVVRTFERPHDDVVYTLKARGMLSITTTPEHPFWVKRYATASPEWITASNLELGMFLGIPRVRAGAANTLVMFPTNHAARRRPELQGPVTVDHGFAWFAGRFVADGSTTIYDEAGDPRGRCELTFALTDDQAEVDRSLAVARRFGVSNLVRTETAQQLMFGRLTVAQSFRQWFGKGAAAKRIPPAIQDNADLEIVRQFLIGYFSGDGHVVKNGPTAGYMIASTVSRVLALQLQQMCLRLGLFATVSRQERTDDLHTIRGKEIHRLPFRYIINLRASDLQRLTTGQEISESIYTNRRPLWNDDWIWTPLEAVYTDYYSGTVYNLETESHTYCAENVAVHNCGLNPTAKWEKGQKRPWNARLKVLCWKIGQSFMKVQNNPKDVYGKVYAQRKLEEYLRNFQGVYAEQAVAATTSKRMREDTQGIKFYQGWYKLPDMPLAELAAIAMQGADALRSTLILGAKGEGVCMLPPAHIDARARRYAVKLYLAHWQHVCFEDHYGTPPPKPYVIEHLGHVHYLSPPGWPM